jgi:hypothetical protein
MVEQEEKQFINEMCQESGIGLVERLRAEIAALQELLNQKDDLIVDLMAISASLVKEAVS